MLQASSDLRRRLNGICLLLLALVPSVLPAAGETAEQVRVFIWSDYAAPTTFSGFQAQSGTEVIQRHFTSNGALEKQLLAGGDPFDLVFPTARPFAARQPRAALYRPLDKSKLPGLDRLDPLIMARLAEVDPGNRYLVPYLWGTSVLGVNAAKVHSLLGDDVALDTWGLLLDPAKASKLADCGITVLDDPIEVFAAALAYLGRDPESNAPADLEAVAKLLRAIRPFIRRFDSEGFIPGLAEGELCLSMGYSGDVVQAATLAEEADNGIAIEVFIPREGATIWTDVMAIPRDAPNPEAAHALIAYLLQPEVIAEISNYVYYANPNRGATALLDAELRDDPAIYPVAEVAERLHIPGHRSDTDLRHLSRLWEDIKAGR